MTAALHTQTYINTHITDATMRASGRSVELAGGTPFHTERYAVNLDITAQSQSRVGSLTLLLIGCRKIKL